MAHDFRSTLDFPDGPWPPNDFTGIEDGLRPLSSALSEAVDAAAHSFTIAPLCESPIESLLGGRLAYALHKAATRHRLQFQVCEQQKQREIDAPERLLLLIPQFKWKWWRFDFALKYSHHSKPFLFVECDGKEFHSTPEQLENDRRKNEEAARINVRLVRFTGADIFRDSDACVAWLIKVIFL